MQATYDAGVEYVLTDKFCDVVRNLEGFEKLGAYVPRHAWEHRAKLQAQKTFIDHAAGANSASHPRFLVLTMGGLGDYLALLPALLTEQKRLAPAALDLAAERIGYDLLKCLGFKGRFVELPLRKSTADAYDAICCIEDITDHPRFRDAPLATLFSDLLGTDGPFESPNLLLSDTIHKQASLPATHRKRIGVQVRGSSALRSYPSPLLADLLRLCVSSGFEVYLFGDAGACDIPSAPPLLHNWCGRTPAIESLVALAIQMDLLVAPDSFMVHLGAALDIPTVGIFSVVPASLRVPEPSSVRVLEPAIGCNPCFGRGVCPEGFDSCKVWEHPAMAPHAVFATIMEFLAQPVPIDRSPAGASNSFHAEPSAVA